MIAVRIAQALTAGQRAILAELDHYGRGRKVRNGWSIGGRFHRTATVRSLLSAGLVTEAFLLGQHLLHLTQRGHAALAEATSRARRRA